MSQCTKRPNVYFFRVGLAFDDLWSKPVHRTYFLLCLAVGLALVYSIRTAQVSDFYITIKAAEDVFCFDISVYYVLLVHRLQPLGNIVKSILAKLFALSLKINNDIIKASTIHFFKNDE